MSEPTKDGVAATERRVTLSTVMAEGEPAQVELAAGQRIVAAKLIRRDKYAVTIETEEAGLPEWIRSPGRPVIEGKDGVMRETR